MYVPLAMKQKSHARSRRRAVAAGWVLVLAAALAGCGPATVRLNEDDHGTVQSVEIGSRIVVRLEGTPSAGFNWTRTLPAGEAIYASPLDPVEEGVWQYPTGGSMPGARGICVFEYAVVRAGTVTLSFAYARPWEGEPVETLTVTLWARE